jgi:hypothetical protein
MFSFYILHHFWANLQLTVISVSITAVQMKAISSVQCTEASQNNAGCSFISVHSHGSHPANYNEPTIDNTILSILLVTICINLIDGVKFYFGLTGQ